MFFRATNVSRAIVAVGVLTCALGTRPALASETWEGSLDCGPIVPLHEGRLHAPFTMTIDGAEARFSRGVQTPQGGQLGVAEIGTGTVADGAVTLNGKIAIRNYSMFSTYAGHLDAGRAVLRGEQVISTPVVNPPYHRPCTVTLKR